MWRDRGCFISERSLQNGAVPRVTIVVTTNNIGGIKTNWMHFTFGDLPGAEGAGYSSLRPSGDTILEKENKEMQGK